MEIIIENIADNACFEYTGDVHVTANIGKCATVIVNDGNLTVDGDIGMNTHVILINSINEKSPGVSLQVQGNVLDQVTVTTTSGDLNVAGNIGRHCKFYTKNGGIAGTNIGSDTFLNTKCGLIEVSNVGSNSKLMTGKGDINAEIVEKHASLITMKGDVRVDSAHRTAYLKSVCGDVYVGGVKREKPNHQSSTLTNNTSFIGGAMNKRIASHANQKSDELPVRFTK